MEGREELILCVCDLRVGIWELGDLTVCVHELGVPMKGQGLGDYGESFFLSMMYGL